MTVKAALTTDLWTGFESCVGPKWADWIAQSEPVRVAGVAYKIGMDQLSRIQGIGIHIKAANIGCKFYQIATTVSVGAKAIFAGIKESSSHAGAFGSIAVMYGCFQALDSKIGEFCAHIKSVDPRAAEDAIGAGFTATSTITYLFSRVMLVLEYLKNFINVPGLEWITSTLALPNQVLFLVGGICQSTVAGVRLVSYFVGADWFAKETTKDPFDKKKDLSKTANMVMDLLKFGEGLSWIAEASIMLVGCTNPVIGLSALAVSTGFKLGQIYVVPYVQEYFGDVVRKPVAQV